MSWCFRLDQELLHSNVSFFVTLTYNDDNLVYADDEPCLYKRDLQLHFKRIRKRVEPKTIKYFAVGEYGNLGRPHYHYLIFYRGNKSRFDFMRIIKDEWDKGFTKVLPVDGAQGYVTKYILKHDQRTFIVPVFSMISHGIGIDYLSTSMVKYLRRNMLSFAIKAGGFKITLPRYYKDKVFNSYDKIILKKRADLHRVKLNELKFNRFDAMLDVGINPFAEAHRRYMQDVYNSLNIYNQKHKL